MKPRLRARAWMSSTGESGWHAVEVSAAGGSVVAVCGHRIYGPVHRILGTLPPQNGVRTICQPCAQITGAQPSRQPRTSPRATSPQRDLDIDWPDEDQDAAPTKRKVVLEAALATLPTDWPEPSRLPRPGTGPSGGSGDLPRLAA